MGHLKSLIEFVTLLFLFYVLIFWPQGVKPTPCTGRWRLNHWTAREVLGLFFHDTFYYVHEMKWSEVEVAQSCLTVCNPILTKSVHLLRSLGEISQVRILEWVVISFSRGSSWPRDRTYASCSQVDIFLPLSQLGSPFYIILNQYW